MNFSCSNLFSTEPQHLHAMYHVALFTLKYKFHVTFLYSFLFFIYALVPPVRAFRFLRRPHHPKSKRPAVAGREVFSGSSSLEETISNRNY